MKGKEACFQVTYLQKQPYRNKINLMLLHERLQNLVQGFSLDKHPVSGLKPKSNGCGQPHTEVWGYLFLETPEKRMWECLKQKPHFKGLLFLENTGHSHQKIEALGGVIVPLVVLHSSDIVEVNESREVFGIPVFKTQIGIHQRL